MDRLRQDPFRGWGEFLDRYASDLLAWTRQLGFDRDESMDRFVYVCEKLSDDRCRRLREVRRLGDRGELTPWLRAVVRNLVVNWHWSRHGRPRLPKAIEALGDREQRVFRAHYWEGLGPAEIRERLEAEGSAIELAQVFDALEKVFEVLSDVDRWRLASGLLTRQPAVEIERLNEPAAKTMGAEESLLRRERLENARGAISRLEASERLLLQLRYEESCTYTEVASIVGCDPATARRRITRVLERLQMEVQEEGTVPT